MPVDEINPAAAAGAYANIQKAGQGAGVDGGDGPSFGDLMRKTATDSINAIRSGEKASAQAVMGTASLTDVVEAITNAEMTLQTVIAVRDRLLGAYQEIMRMPI
ncbi:MAG: flagellar hook-basal body complex protein FliE [Proteobacteria bacterium]|nr:flagellar hook-basal body complex protein FliE [Pseudomonadota bacterium]